MSAPVTARARSDRPRLVIPSAPQVGEGIVELIVRAASENSYACFGRAKVLYR